MNTAMEEIYSRKCCAYHDLNLEIQVKNTGSEPLSVSSHCDFEGNGKTERVENLMPHGVHILEPAGQMSFYCYMDEFRFEQFNKLVMYDEAGNTYQIEINE